MDPVTIGILGGAALLVLIVGLTVVFGTFFTVEQQSCAVVERFGKFVRIAKPGLNLKWPLIESVVGAKSLRVQSLDVKVETKTHDNVFVHVTVALQYFVHEAKVYEAYYKLDDPEKQITSFVFDVVRAQVPLVALDDVFSRKDEIANAVKQEITQTMDNFGYGILKALVTDIDPAAKVKEAMNEINAAQRMRLAANEKGEAEKILRVKAAEAEAASKKLQGEGIAAQRKAIIEGLKESVEQFQKGIPDSTAKDVMSLVLMTQYFDTLKEIGASSKSNTLLIPHSPGALGEMMSQIRSTLLAADQTAAAGRE